MEECKNKSLSDALGIDYVYIEYDPSDKIFYEYDPKICREETLKRNADIVTCDKCGVTGNRPNMIRWHFEACKTILKKCEYCDSLIPRQGIKDFLYTQKKFCNRNCYMKSKLGIAPISMTDEIKNKLSVSAKNRSSILSERIKKNKPWEKRWNK